MDTGFPWDWVLVVVTAAAITMIRKRAFWAVTAGLLAEVLWIWYAISTEQFGFIAGAVFLGIPVGYNAYLWYQSKTWEEAWLNARKTGKQGALLLKDQGRKIVQQEPKPQTTPVNELFAMKNTLQEEYPWSIELPEADMLTFAEQALEALKTGIPAGDYQQFVRVVEEWHQRVPEGTS